MLASVALAAVFFQVGPIFMGNVMAGRSLVFLQHVHRNGG